MTLSAVTSHHLSRLAALIASACIPALACTKAADRTRRWDSAGWNVAWTRGGIRDTGLFQYPLQIATDGKRAYVSEAGLGEIIALSATDGKPLWRFGGPTNRSQLLNPSTVFMSRGGRVVVVDESRRRLLWLDTLGQLSRRLDLAAALGHVRTACELSSNRYLIGSQDGAAVVLDTIGFVHDRLALSDPRATEGGIAASYGWLSTNASGTGCLFALSPGGDFATIDSNAVVHWFPYVETVSSGDRDGRNRPLQTAIAASLQSSRASFAFAGTGRWAMREIDDYDAGTGQYITSVHLPRHVVWFARTGDIIFVIHGVNGQPAVSALTRKSGGHRS